MAIRLRERAASTTDEAVHEAARTGAEVDPAAAKRAAVQRVQARRRADRGPADSEFLPPQNAGQWLDDVIGLVLPAAGPFTTLITILEAARHGEDAAREAVRAAAELTGQGQCDAFTTLALQLPAPVPAAQQLAAVIADEWGRIGLQTTPTSPAAAEGESR